MIQMSNVSCAHRGYVFACALDERETSSYEDPTHLSTTEFLSSTRGNASLFSPIKSRRQPRKSEGLESLAYRARSTSACTGVRASCLRVRKAWTEGTAGLVGSSGAGGKAV